MTSAYYSMKEIATLLLCHPHHLRRILPDLVASGFPEPCPITRQFRRDRVDAWIGEHARERAMVFATIPPHSASRTSAQAGPEGNRVY